MVEVAFAGTVHLVPHPEVCGIHHWAERCWCGPERDTKGRVRHRPSILLCAIPDGLPERAL